MTGGYGTADAKRISISQLGSARGKGAQSHKHFKAAQEIMQALDSGVLSQDQLQQIQQVTSRVHFGDKKDELEYFGPDGVLSEGYRISTDIAKRKASQQMFTSLGLGSATATQQKRAFAIGRGDASSVSAALKESLRSTGTSAQDIVSNLLGSQFERGLTQEERATLAKTQDSYLDSTSEKEREQNAKAFAKELGAILEGRAEDYQTRSGTTGGPADPESSAQNELNSTLKDLRDHIKNESLVLKA